MYRSSFSLLLSGLFFAFLTIGCGDDGSPADDVCAPGATQICTGPGGCVGGQSCLPDASGWGECLCDAPPPSDAGTDGGPQVDAGEDAGPLLDAGGSPIDECINVPDQAILMSDGGDASAIARDCAMDDCLAELIGGDRASAETCINVCMDVSTVGALSDGCTDCFVDTAFCGAASCAAECGFGTEMECDDCIAQNCTPAFASCSGLPAP